MIPISRPNIGLLERQAVDQVLESGQLTQGAEVAAFESEFAPLVADRHCIAVNSGTSALHLALLSLGIGSGDEVIVPSFTFAATPNSVALTGAKPVFVDIEPRYFCIDPAAVQAAITPRTRAVMPVHLYGHPAAMSALQEVCRDRGIFIIEDASQAHGAALEGRPVGAWGDAGTFSFYATKNMTTGEGGLVSVEDPEVARRLRLLRNQGQERRYENEIAGLNNRMTDMQAAIGRVQLRSLAEWTKTRQDNAEFYSTNLRGVVVPESDPRAEHVFHQYTIRVVDLDRDNFVDELANRGIGTGVYYPTPCHWLPSFESGLCLSETERASQECLSIPVHPLVSTDEREHIVASINSLARVGS